MRTPTEYMKTTLAPGAPWYEVAKVKDKTVVKKKRTKPPQIDENFKTFGNIFSYMSMSIQYPHVVYEGIDGEETYVTINMENGNIKFRDCKEEIIYNFLLSFYMSSS